MNVKGTTALGVECCNELRTRTSGRNRVLPTVRMAGIATLAPFFSTGKVDGVDQVIWAQSKVSPLCYVRWTEIAMCIVFDIAVCNVQII